MYCLHLPQFLPATVNQLMRSVGARIRLKKGDRDIICHYAKLSGIPHAIERRRVSLRLVLPKGARAPDPDAVFKSLADGLVAAGMLGNDSSRWVEWGPVKFLRAPDGTRETFVLLEDF